MRMCALRASLRFRGRVRSGAFVQLARELRGVIFAPGGNRPTSDARVRRDGVVTAVILIDHAQVEAEVVGARRARRQYATGE
jgi:hypothetical protein